MKIINVIGTSGSGKTTFAKVLAEKLNSTYIELDNLYWKDYWEESSDEELSLNYSNAISKAKMNEISKGIIIDGCYSRFRSLIWQDIDTVIWINIPFHVNLYQTLKRTIGRVISQKKLWENSNNKESLKMILSKDSIIFWMLKTHFKNRKKYANWMKDPQYSHIHFIELNSKKEINLYFDSLTDQNNKHKSKSLL